MNELRMRNEIFNEPDMSLTKVGCEAYSRDSKALWQKTGATADQHLPMLTLADENINPATLDKPQEYDPEQDVLAKLMLKQEDPKGICPSKPAPIWEDPINHQAPRFEPLMIEPLKYKAPTAVKVMDERNENHG